MPSLQACLAHAVELQTIWRPPARVPHRDLIFLGLSLFSFLFLFAYLMPINLFCLFSAYLNTYHFWLKSHSSRPSLHLCAVVDRSRMNGGQYDCAHKHKGALHARLPRWRDYFRQYSFQVIPYLAFPSFLNFVILLWFVLCKYVHIILHIMCSIM